MKFRTEILFSAPMSELEIERTEIMGKVLPDIRALCEKMAQAGMDVTLTVRTVNGVIGKSRKKEAAPVPPAKQLAHEAMQDLMSRTEVNQVPGRDPETAIRAPRQAAE